MAVNAAGFDTAGAMTVLRVNVDDYAEVWVNGEMPRAGGPAAPFAVLAGRFQLGGDRVGQARVVG